jgi:hypothetical protein
MSPSRSPSSTSTLASSSTCPSLTNIPNVPSIFLDPNFDLNDRETFEKIFPFLTSSNVNKSNPKEEAAFICQQVSFSFFHSISLNNKKKSNLAESQYADDFFV